MNQTIKILLYFSLLIYIVVALIFSAVLSHFKLRHAQNSAKKKTDPFVNSLSYVVVFCGPQGSGKTTLASGFTNIQTKLFKNAAQKRLDDIRLIFSKIDFTEIDAAITFCFSRRKYNTDYVIGILFSIEAGKYRTIFGPLAPAYDDGLNYIPALELFRDYIDAFIAILKNNYVYFINSEYYSRVTFNYAQPLTHKSLAIKDCYLKHDYNIYRYSIIFEDEILLGSGNNQNRFNEAEEDPGFDSFLRIIRHIGKGNLKYYLCAQDFTRINKARRELTTNILECRKFKEIECSSIKRWLFSIGLSILRYIKQLFKDSFSDAILKTYFQKSNNLIKIESYFQLKLDEFKANNYLKYYGIMYTSEEDYRKPLNQCSSFSVNYNLFLPAVYCRGSTNTYEYSSVHDVLSYESRYCTAALDIDPQPTMASREAYAKQILRKRSSAASPSPPSSSSPPSPPSGTNDVSVIT